MNERDFASEVFKSPKGRSKHSIHSRFWRQTQYNGRLTLSQERARDDHRSAKEKRKDRIREEKRKAMLDYVERMRRRNTKRELARLNNNKIRQELDRRRAEKARLSKGKNGGNSDKNTLNSQKKKVKRIRKRIIRRKIIRRRKRRPSDPQTGDDKGEIIEIVEEEIVEQIPDGESTASVTVASTSGSQHANIVKESEDLEDEMECIDDSDKNLSDSGYEEEILGGIDENDEESYIEIAVDDEDQGFFDDSESDQFDEVLLSTSQHEQTDEEAFFAKVRADEDSKHDVPMTEEEAFRLEQEELFRLAAQRQAEEEEDLKWEEEELLREEEARRLAEEQELERLCNLSMEEHQHAALNAVLMSRPAKPKPIKTRKVENVLEKPVGYRDPSLIALVNKAKTELRPPPPPEHKEEYIPIVADASSIGRFVRLNEKTIETQGKSEKQSKTDASYKSWENQHARRGDQRKPITVNTRSDAQIMVNEAAAVGKLRKRRSGSQSDFSSPRLAEIDIDELGDAKHDGAKVFRTEHLIDRHIQENRRQTDWTPEYNFNEYETLDDVILPTAKQPPFTPRKNQKTKEELREELSRGVAEGYWGRHYRLERPGAQLKITPGCFCKYCNSANAWQTFAYQKKWADEKLPPKFELEEEPDPSKFGYIARLYLPEKSQHEEIEIVDLKAAPVHNLKDLEMISVDGTCSVDFTFESEELAFFDASDDELSQTNKSETKEQSFLPDSEGRRAKENQDKDPVVVKPDSNAKEGLPNDSVRQAPMDGITGIFRPGRRTTASVASTRSTRSGSQKQRRFRPVKWMQKMVGRPTKSLSGGDKTKSTLETVKSQGKTGSLNDVEAAEMSKPTATPAVTEVNTPARQLEDGLNEKDMNGENSEEAQGPSNEDSAIRLEQCAAREPISTVAAFVSVEDAESEDTKPPLEQEDLVRSLPAETRSISDGDQEIAKEAKSESKQHLPTARPSIFKSKMNQLSILREKAKRDQEMKEKMLLPASTDKVIDESTRAKRISSSLLARVATFEASSKDSTMQMDKAKLSLVPSRSKNQVSDTVESFKEATESGVEKTVEVDGERATAIHEMVVDRAGGLESRLLGDDAEKMDPVAPKLSDTSSILEKTSDHERESSLHGQAKGSTALEAERPRNQDKKRRNSSPKFLASLAVFDQATYQC